MEIISCSLAETADLAEKIMVELVRRHKQNKSATVVGLEGELGSGKTTFVQLAARALGVRAPVTSPTFVIIKTYSIPRRQGESLPFGKDSPCQCPWRRLVHIDCYRLETAEELVKLDWCELVADSANLIMVEWLERIGELLSAGTHKITFEILGESERKIIYAGH